jgi:hypothetical protein
MAAHSDAVDMKRLSDMNPLPRWLEDVDHATEAEGERWLEFCVKGWVNELSRKV